MTLFRIIYIIIGLVLIIRGWYLYFQIGAEYRGKPELFIQTTATALIIIVGILMNI